MYIYYCTYIIQLPTPGGSSPPTDHSKRDYADIDFATTQKLEKSILKDDNASTSHVTLPPKLPSKNTGSVEDKSGYVEVCDVHVNYIILYVIHG